MLPRSLPQDSLSAESSWYRRAKIPSPSTARSLRLHEVTPRWTDCPPSSERWSYMPLLLFSNSQSVAVTILEATETLECSIVFFSRTLEKVPVVRPFNSQAPEQRQI
jgi:hypothetical protein